MRFNHNSKLENPITPEQDPIEIALFAADLSSETPSIDLHGISSMQEAKRTLESYIHSEFSFPPRNDIKVIKIIHGRGEGKLRLAVTQVLKDLPFVEKFRTSQDPKQTNAVTLIALSPNKK